MAARKSVEVFECEGEVLRVAVRDGPLHCLLFRPGNPALEVPAALSIGHSSQSLAGRSSTEANSLGLQQDSKNPSADVQVGQGNQDLLREPA